MNLQESNLFKQDLKKKSRSKKGIIISIVICAFLIAILLIMIIMINYQDSVTLKMYLDNTQISIPTDFYREIDGIVYINVKDIGNLLGYTYTRGEYGEYNENEDSCYLENDYEILAITAGSDKFSKYIQMSPDATLADIKAVAKNKNGYCETFKIKNPVKFEDGILFADADNIGDMFNVQLQFEEYRIRIYSLNYIINMTKTSITKLGVAEMSGSYENFRALLDGFVVAGNGDGTTPSTVYGVVSLADGSEIISKKYSDITYVQNSKEFYITTDNGTVGILNSEGGTIIPPSEYDEISLLDQDNYLYLVKKDEQYGVLDKNGKPIVYAENEKIGLDVEDYPLVPIENNYLILGKCIPALRDGKYGLYDVEGNTILPINYDGFGYKVDSRVDTSGNEQSVLIIPSTLGISGIVVNFNDLYGIYDVNKEKLVLPCIAEKIYAITRSGKTTYYMQYNGSSTNIEDWITENNIRDIDENGNYIDTVEPE